MPWIIINSPIDIVINQVLFAILVPSVQAERRPFYFYDISRGIYAFTKIRPEFSRGRIKRSAPGTQINEPAFDIAHFFNNFRTFLAEQLFADVCVFLRRGP
jgi:hypothetical protein